MTSKNLNATKESLVSTPSVTKTAKELAKEKLKDLIAEETRVVKGIFQCFETPGLTVKIFVRKYPGIPAFEKLMTDGEIYEVPLYVARHLNGIDASASAINGAVHTCSHLVHGFKMPNTNDLAPSTIGQEGIPVPVVTGKYKKRYGFQSLEFGTAVA